MADTNINVNKIDYQIRAEYNQRADLPDGSVLFLKYVEEGKDSATLTPSYYAGEYRVQFTHKAKRLTKFISIKRKSTNNYFMIACEVGGADGRREFFVDDGDQPFFTRKLYHTHRGSERKKDGQGVRKRAAARKIRQSKSQSESAAGSEKAVFQTRSSAPKVTRACAFICSSKAAEAARK